MAAVVTLVPWRGGDELREQSWDIVRPRLEGLGFPVYTGDSDGLWARAAAVNAAARDAGNWSVAVIGDADTIPDAKVIRQSVSRVKEERGAIRPHDRLLRLSPSGSIAYARGSALEERHIMGEQLGGGFLVVHRDAWDRVGGMDERFVGWGHEDTAFNISLITKALWDRVPGIAWHLWHPDPPRKTREYVRNRQLLEQVRRDNRIAIREAEQRMGWSVGKVL